MKDHFFFTNRILFSPSTFLGWVRPRRFLFGYKPFYELSVSSKVRPFPSVLVFLKVLKLSFHPTQIPPFNKWSFFLLFVFFFCLFVLLVFLLFWVVSLLFRDFFPVFPLDRGLIELIFSSFSRSSFPTWTSRTWRVFRSS